MPSRYVLFKIYFYILNHHVQNGVNKTYEWVKYLMEGHTTNQM